MLTVDSMENWYEAGQLDRHNGPRLLSWVWAVLFVNLSYKHLHKFDINENPVISEEHSYPTHAHECVQIYA